MVKIITDTTFCLSHSVAEKYDIPIIPHAGPGVLAVGFFLDDF